MCLSVCAGRESLGRVCLGVCVCVFVRSKQLAPQQLLLCWDSFCSLKSDPANIGPTSGAVVSLLRNPRCVGLLCPHWFVVHMYGLQACRAVGLWQCVSSTRDTHVIQKGGSEQPLPQKHTGQSQGLCVHNIFWGMCYDCYVNRCRGTAGPCVLQAVLFAACLGRCVLEMACS